MSGSSTKDIPTDVAEAWQELCEKDDRTSPAEHPDMCLITRDELLGYMSLASAEGERRGIDRAAQAAYDLETYADDGETHFVHDETQNAIVMAIRALPTRPSRGRRRRCGLRMFQP